MLYKERSVLFRSDTILVTLLDTFKEYVTSKGFIIQPYNDNNFQSRVYSTKTLLLMDDIPVNNLHVDENNRDIKRALSDPGYYVEKALYYFREIRSIPERVDASCWIYMEISIRCVCVSMTIVNLNNTDELY